MLPGIALGALFLVSSCGQSPEEKAARSLYAQAEAHAQAGSYVVAVQLLDSIERNYKDQIDVRRDAMHLRPGIIEEATLIEISTNDSLQAEMRKAYEEALPSMKKVNREELVEPYWIAADGNNDNFLNTTGVQARVSADGEFYMLSEVIGAGNLHHNSFTLKTKSGESVSSGVVPFDGELNYRISGSETVTYDAARCDSVGMFAEQHQSTPMTLIFNGEDGKSKSINLTAKQVDGIAAAYRMGHALTQGHRLALQRNMLEKRLAIARDQKARTFRE
ncbi:MAG: hypothetical protein K2I57_05435 [Muribaculaceae bacterium]|nr:hypothetical protein [Muribaculaceae bacterium]